MSILLTGGSGYIGTHTAIELMRHGHRVVVFDNFSNSHPQALQRVERIAGQAVPVVCADVRDEAALRQTLREHHVQCVIHLAGLKAVNESLTQPVDYFDVNVGGSLCLLRSMQACGIRRLVFSSSANVYGAPHYLPLDEGHPTAPANPYGRSKLMVEHMLADLHRSDPRWAITVLRYCNPMGAHPSGWIGEDPQNIPNNLPPYVTQVAVGRRSHVDIFGDDYDTPDGTGVRDYIHVMDLALGHVRAVEHQLHHAAQWLVANLGTGRGYSVREVIAAFERACGRSIATRVCPRRAGDVASFYADPRQAWQTLGWRAQHDLDSMCRDAWRWQSRHPQGYGEAGVPALAPQSCMQPA